MVIVGNNHSFTNG